MTNPSAQPVSDGEQQYLDEPCPRCKGTGKNPDDSVLGYPGEPCYYCSGTGKRPMLNAQPSRLVMKYANQRYQDGYQSGYAAAVGDAVGAMPEKQDEHPTDSQTGEPVEVYGYEATYNEALDRYRTAIEALAPTKQISKGE